MSASLTLQIRLGFSLGWRIWTPNEVGFYAKTLAHSYFIYIILKSKLLKKMLWVVNYTIFMGHKKYFVFLEFLEFGLKSKEERTRWKKIMYIGLIVQNFNKIILSNSEESGLFKLNSVAKYIKANKSFKDKSFAVRKYFSKTSKTLSLFKPGAKKFKDDLISNSMIFKSKFKLKKKKKSKLKNQYCTDFIYSTRSDALRVVLLKKKQQRKGRWMVPFFFKTKKKRILKNLIFKPSKFFLILKKKVRIKNKKAFPRLRCALKKRFYIKKKKLSKKHKKIKKWYLRSFKVDKKTLKNQSTDFLDSYSSIVNSPYSKKFKMPKNRDALHSIKENLTKVSFATFNKARLKLKSPRSISIAGGPRKRFYRNLKRAFKGKFIKECENLIWFWEKVSRMVTYYVRCIKWGIL